jgi:hypothetical protein
MVAPGTLHRVLGFAELAVPVGTSFLLSASILWLTRGAPFASKPRTLAKEFKEAEKKAVHSAVSCREGHLGWSAC